MTLSSNLLTCLWVAWSFIAHAEKDIAEWLGIILCSNTIIATSAFFDSGGKRQRYTKQIHDQDPNISRAMWLSYLNEATFQEGGLSNGLWIVYLHFIQVRHIFSFIQKMTQQVKDQLFSYPSFTTAQSHYLKCNFQLYWFWE